MVDALRGGELSAGQLAAAAGWSDHPERAERVVSGLVGDGLVARGRNGRFRLP
jgi:hypothetical protein